MGRPANFDINAAHPLARNLIFAGLGFIRSQRLYYDFSLKRNHGYKIANPLFPYNMELNRHIISLNGTTQYIALSKPLQSYIPTALSGSAWIFFSDTTLNKNIISLGIGKGADRFYLIKSNQTLITGVGGTYPTNAQYANLQLNKWQHVALTAQTGSSVNVVKLYYNGLLVKQATFLTWDRISPTCQIGCIYSTLSWCFPGLIADPMIWNRALTAQEIKILANKHDYTLGGLIV